MKEKILEVRIPYDDGIKNEVELATMIVSSLFKSNINHFDNDYVENELDYIKDYFIISIRNMHYLRIHFHKELVIENTEYTLEKFTDFYKINSMIKVLETKSTADFLKCINVYKKNSDNENSYFNIYIWLDNDNLGQYYIL